MEIRKEKIPKASTEVEFWGLHTQSSNKEALLREQIKAIEKRKEKCRIVIKKQTMILSSN
jgi:hypothetical protein